MTGKVLAKKFARGPAPTTERNKKPKKKIPINAKIYTTLRRRIVKAAYAKSGYLPPELDLMDEFRVSRHTIRTALQKLVVDGLIERQRGTRTKSFDVTRRKEFGAIGSLDQMVGEFLCSGRSLRAGRQGGAISRDGPPFRGQQGGFAISRGPNNEIAPRDTKLFNDIHTGGVRNARSSRPHHLRTTF